MDYWSQIFPACYIDIKFSLFLICPLHIAPEVLWSSWVVETCLTMFSWGQSLLSCCTSINTNTFSMLLNILWSKLFWRCFALTFWFFFTSFRIAHCALCRPIPGASRSSSGTIADNLSHCDIHFFWNAFVTFSCEYSFDWWKTRVKKFSEKSWEEQSLPVRKVPFFSVIFFRCFEFVWCYKLEKEVDVSGTKSEGDLTSVGLPN